MIKTLGILLTILALTGCKSLGPRSVSESHALYGEAISNSLNEQFLQNLVRLRYRDTPYFLEVGSVTASLKFESAMGLESTLSKGSSPDIWSPAAGVKYSNSPTISYSPLQGEEFFRKMLVAVPLEAIFVLMQSGWSADRVFGICVERVNDLVNAPSASGPTPTQPPSEYSEFKNLVELLENVRNKGVVNSDIDRETGKFEVGFRSTPRDAGTIAEIKRSLDLDQGMEVYPVTNNFLQREPNSIAIRTRSIMSILFYLSQSVDTPAMHEEAGIVTVTRNEDGSRFDWGSTPAGRLFHVRQAQRRPESAFIAVPYRDHWFYIANDDLDAKSSFMLMTQIFNLNAGVAKTVTPTLTIPTGQ